MDLVNKKVEFYFDYLSPFAYFAWQRFKNLQIPNKPRLIFRPVLLGQILNHYEIRHPATVPGRVKFVTRYVPFLAKQLQIPFTIPKTSHFPFSTFEALKLSTEVVSGEHQERVVDALFDLVWKEGKDPGNPEYLCECVGEDIFQNLQQLGREAKKEVRAHIASALEKEVFGVPTFVMGEQLYWGQDSLNMLLEDLQ